MDDVLIAGRDRKHHDEILEKVVRKDTKWNLKLNFEKCQIRKTSVKYVGHVVTSEGLKIDPDKVPRPESKEDIQRFLGFVQYIAKFIPGLSEVDGPLCELARKDAEFVWEELQQKSFQKLKDMCCDAPILVYYDVKKPVTIQCDASSPTPVAYTSRALTDTEKNGYAQIEKETLVIVHCCKKFHHYIFGKVVTIENDHKPLQAIFAKTTSRGTNAAPVYDVEVAAIRPGCDL